LDDLAKQLGLGDRLDDAPRRVLAQDRLDLRLAAARDDRKRSKQRLLEVFDDAAVLADDQREAEDRAGHSCLGQLLLAHPARRERRGLQRVPHENAHLVARVQDLVPDATAQESGRAEQKYPSHGGNPKCWDTEPSWPGPLSRAGSYSESSPSCWAWGRLRRL